jgi:hypothetical protein
MSSQEFSEKGLPAVDRLARCIQDRVTRRGARWRRCEKQSCLFEGLPNRRHLIRFILYVVVVASRKDLGKVVMAIANGKGNWSHVHARKGSRLWIPMYEEDLVSRVEYDKTGRGPWS